MILFLFQFVGTWDDQWVGNLPGLRYTRRWNVECGMCGRNVQEMVGLYLDCEFYVLMVIIEAF